MSLTTCPVLRDQALANEALSEKRDAEISEETRQNKSLDAWVAQGPPKGRILLNPLFSPLASKIVLEGGRGMNKRRINSLVPAKNRLSRFAVTRISLSPDSIELHS